MTDKTEKSTYELVTQQVREHLIPLNAVIALCITVWAVIDFASPLLGVPGLLLVAGVMALAASWCFWRLPAEPMQQRLKALGFGLVLSALGLGSASATLRAEQGGWIASSFGKARDVQTVLFDLQTQVARVQQGVDQANSTLGRIDERTGTMATVVEGVKREISDDPRKELANLGVAWDRYNMVKAFEGTGDLRTAELFFAGGMPLNQSALHQLLESRAEQIKATLLRFPERVDEETCSGALSMWQPDRVLKASAQDEALVKALCRHDPVLREAQAKLKDEQERLGRQRAAYDRELAERLPVAECKRQLLADGGVELMDQASTVSLTQMGSSPRLLLLREVNIELSVGNVAGIRAVVDAHCQRQATGPPNIGLDDRLARKWQRLVQWLS